jgi:hypothetical protein
VSPRRRAALIGYYVVAPLLVGGIIVALVISVARTIGWTL